jgi:putative membrane protein
MSSRDLGNIIEIFKNDYKSAFSNKIVVITLIAIIIIPSLYAIINIQACWDPYEKTGEMDFAIANMDNGTTYEGYRINVGNDMVNSLNDNKKFHWVLVSEDELREGVKNGTYYAGIIIPQNLSENVVSITTDEPQTAKLIYIVNDKTNPVAPRIMQQAANTIYNEMNAKIIEFINLAAYGKLGELQSGLSSGAGQLSYGSIQLSSGANQISDGADQVSDGVNQVSDGAKQINEGASNLSNGAQQVSDGISQIEEKISNIESAINISAEDVEKMPDGPVKDSIKKVIGFASSTAFLIHGSGDVAKGSIKLSSSASKLANGSTQLAEGSLSLAAGAQLLSNSAAYALAVAAASLSSAADSLSGITGINETILGEYFYSPIKLESIHIYEAENYGSQVAPFYIVLSMWVGALITCVMIKPGISTGTKYSPLEMYFGKLLLYIILAILQATVTAIFCFAMGVYIDNPIMFILSCWFVSVVFMELVYSLISAFGQVGKVISILLLVFQISGTGGIYPIEIMGPVFEAMYPYLPMTYGINIIREASLGLLWSNYIPSFIVLIGILVATVIICLLIKEKADNISHYFENKLEESDLF